MMVRNGLLQKLILMRLKNLQLYVQVLTQDKLMQIKVYSPNGKELSIHTEKNKYMSFMS